MAIASGSGTSQPLRNNYTFNEESDLISYTDLELLKLQHHMHEEEKNSFLLRMIVSSSDSKFRTTLYIIINSTTWNFCSIPFILIVTLKDFIHRLERQNRSVRSNLFASQVGGPVVSALDFLSGGWWFEPGLCRHVVSWDKKLYSISSLFTQVYNWVLAIIMLGVILRWTNNPSGRRMGGGGG